LVLSHDKVGVTEVLGWRAPTDRAELFAVDQQCVEETAPEEQRLEHGWVAAAVEEII